MSVHAQETSVLRDTFENYLADRTKLSMRINLTKEEQVYIFFYSASEILTKDTFIMEMELTAS